MLGAQAAAGMLGTRIRLLALLGALLAAATRVEGQVSYVVTDLGVLPGFASSTATGLNDRGDVVGYCAPGGTGTNLMGFVWRGGVMTGTGKLPKGIYGMATAINGQGVFVGEGDNGNFRPQAWVATPSGLLEFFPNNGGNTHAVGINDTGAICGYFTKSLSGTTSSWRGALWTVDPKDPRKYRMTVLPVLLGPDPTFAGTTAIPWSFNQAGEAAGYATNEVIGQHACLWKNDAAHTIVDLGTFPGDWSSIAWGLNDLGQVAGESHPPFGSRAVVWNNDPARAAVELPPLPGHNSGTALALNTSGHVIGTSFFRAPGSWDNVGPTRPVVWRDGGVFDLQTLLDPTTGAGWVLGEARAINNAGQILGTGTLGGVQRALLLTPRSL